jgi:hypothetical protein
VGELTGLCDVPELGVADELVEWVGVGVGAGPVVLGDGVGVVAVGVGFGVWCAGVWCGEGVLPGFAGAGRDLCAGPLTTLPTVVPDWWAPQISASSGLPVAASRIVMPPIASTKTIAATAVNFSHLVERT